MGVLPEIAQDLLPRLWATAPDQALGQAAIMVSAYALGVVVGAPTIAAWVAQFPRRTVLVSLTVALTAFTLLCALAPTFELAVVARFVCGLPHGAYFGIASLTAAELASPHHRGRAVASVILGLSISNVIGVPAVTALGQSFGWRATFIAVAFIFALASVAIAVTIPATPGTGVSRLRTELRAFARGRVWLAIGLGGIGFAGFFAVYSFVSPIVTGLSHLPPGAVPWALAVLGVGMTIGNMVGGRLADRSPMRTLMILTPLFTVQLAVLIFTAQIPAGLFLGLFLAGFLTSAMVPAIQLRFMDVAGDAQTLSAALNHAALNIGNSLGAAVGGAVIAAGLGLRSPIWVATLFSVFGIGFVIASLIADRRKPISTGSVATSPG